MFAFGRKVGPQELVVPGKSAEAAKAALKPRAGDMAADTVKITSRSLNLCRSLSTGLPERAM